MYDIIMTAACFQKFGRLDVYKPATKLCTYFPRK